MCWSSSAATTRRSTATSCCRTFAIYWGDDDRARAVHRGGSSPHSRPGSRSPRSRTAGASQTTRPATASWRLHLIKEVSRAGFDPRRRVEVLPAGQRTATTASRTAGASSSSRCSAAGPDPDRAGVRQHLLGAQPADRAPLLRLRRRARRGDRSLPAGPAGRRGRVRRAQSTSSSTRNSTAAFLEALIDKDARVHDRPRG